MLYGAQVWGYKGYDGVEKFLRYFLKKIFRLPKNTPNYMLHIETGTPPLLLYTIKMHFNYVLKILQMSECRLPNVVLRSIIRTNGYIFEEWKKTASECGLNLSIEVDEPPHLLRKKINSVLENFGRHTYDK